MTKSIQDIKRQLLHLASIGRPCPAAISIDRDVAFLGEWLGRLVDAKSPHYDPLFVSDLRKYSDDWVKSSYRNKETLLQMARNGMPRPTDAVMKNALGSYTKKSSGSYDAAFDGELRRIAPSWFMDTASHNKHILLQMAQAGMPRPSKSKEFDIRCLDQALARYTRSYKSSYDADFDGMVRSMAPHWFKSVRV